MNTPSHLRGKFLEPLRSERTCRTQRRGRHWWRNGQVESRVKSDGLIHDPETAIEVFELAAQTDKATFHRGGIADVVVRAKETIERGFDEPRFRGLGTLGCSRQPRGHVFGEINAYSGFHGRLAENAIRRSLLVMQTNDVGIGPFLTDMDMRTS
jgi:hypothetical protein